MSAVVCSHLDEIAVRELPPAVDGCEDCLLTGHCVDLRDLVKLEPTTT